MQDLRLLLRNLVRLLLQGDLSVFGALHEVARHWLCFLLGLLCFLGSDVTSTNDDILGLVQTGGDRIAGCGA